MRRGGGGWRRVLVALALVALVSLLGWALMPRGDAGDDAPSVPSTARTRRHASGKWAGLKSAGVPTPGAWSADEAWRTKDGKVSDPSARVRLDRSHGPKTAALDTLDALLDPSGDDAAWGEAVAATLGPDASGQARPAGDRQRAWFKARTFDPSSACGFSAPGAPLMTSACASGAWEADAHDAILATDLFGADATFPASGTGAYPGTQARGYAAVYVPMDDGMWTITVYCPASGKRTPVYVDRRGRETGGDAKGALLPTGETTGAYGTAESPCRTVDWAVSGQRAFWTPAGDDGE